VNSGFSDSLPSADWGEVGGTEQPTAPAGRLAELGGTSHRGHRHRDRALLPCPRSRLFELVRDVFMLAGEQGCAMPSAPVRMVLEHTGQCLVRAPAVCEARALRDRRPDEWVPEPDGLQVGIDDSCLGGGRWGVDIEPGARDRAGGVQDLAERVLVVERGHEQHEPGRLGQIRHARSERVLEPLGQRQSARCRLVVLVPADHRRELEQRQRSGAASCVRPNAASSAAR
jgi:hypothetical protein